MTSRLSEAASGEVTCSSCSHNRHHVGSCWAAQICTCGERPRERHEPACSRAEQRTRGSRGLSKTEPTQRVGQVAGSRQQAQPGTHLHQSSIVVNQKPSSGFPFKLMRCIAQDFCPNPASCCLNASPHDVQCRAMSTPPAQRAPLAATDPSRPGIACASSRPKPKRCCTMRTPGRHYAAQGHPAHSTGLSSACACAAAHHNVDSMYACGRLQPCYKQACLQAQQRFNTGTNSQ